MIARGALLGAVSLMLAGCAAMTMRDIRAVKPDCARIDKQIAMLEKEKAENDQRLLAGIQSVAPALARPQYRRRHLWQERRHRHRRMGGRD